MPSPNAYLWTTDPDYIDLFNFVIERTKNVESPMSRTRLAREFKGTSGATQKVSCFISRIQILQTIIHSFEHIGKKAKVKFLFALSVPVNAHFLEKLNKDALVVVDEKQRIIYYKANDGRLELRGDHSLSARIKNAKNEKRQPKRSLWSLILDYCENKDKADAVPKNEEEKEIWNLIEFITEKCENADSPLNIRPLARDFNKHSGTSRSFATTYDSLRKDAVVEVDDQNRITKYIANNGRLTLNGNHSQSTKRKSGWIEWKKKNTAVEKNDHSGGDEGEESDRGDGYSDDDSNEYSSEEFDSEFDSINYNYHLDEPEVFIEPSNEAVDFDDDIPVLPPTYMSMDDYSDFDPPTERFHQTDEIEMREDEENSGNIGNAAVKTRKFQMSRTISNRCTADPEYIELFNYLIAKTKDAKSPINIQQLIRDFKEKSGTALSESCFRSRIDKIRKDIHCFDHIDTDTKVRMLFALSAPVDRDFLEKLSNNALVEVDENNRITNYKSERLELKGYHRLLTTCDIKNYWTTDMECIDLLNYLIEATEYVKPPINLAQLAKDFKKKSGTFQTAESLEQRIIQVRCIIHNFDLIDTNTKVKLIFALSVPVNSYFLEELKENAAVQVDKQNRITYYKAINDRLKLSGEHSLAAKLKTAQIESKRSDRPPTFETPKPSKRKADIWVPSSSKRTFSSPDHSSLELHFDYDTNYSVNDQVKLEPFCGEIQEDLNGIVDDKDIQQIPKSLQAHDEDNQIEEIRIKIELEEPMEIKPETSHNSKIKFFEAMQSLILCLDSPSLSDILLKIQQKIQTIGGLDEVILNNKIVQIVDSLISQMSNTSVVNLSENAESVNFSTFLCHLKTAILNTELSGVEDLVQNISKLIEESQDKRVPMEKVTDALRATLGINGF